MKDLFLKCSDEERTQAWLEMVSKLPIELVKKIDSDMQEIQKYRGSQPKSNVTAVTTVAPATTNPATTTLAMMTLATTTPATPLNPTNDIMFAGLFGLNDAEKKKFVRKQERDLRKIQQKVQIQEKNKELLHESRDKGTIQTPPERKPAVAIEDNMRPAIEIGEFVKVDADTSPGRNRPGGTGFVESVRGVGAATTVTIRYHGVENRKYKDIPLSALTSLVFGNTFRIIERKRTIKARQIMDPSPPKLYPNNNIQNGKRSRMERFIEELKPGGRYNMMRGWHRQCHYPNQSKLPHQLSLVERQQLWGEINLLEAHLLSYCPNQTKPKKDSTTGKFLRQKVNPLTLDFLVQQAWGIGKMYLSRFRSKRDG
jgi:hypothetical protein